MFKLRIFAVVWISILFLVSSCSSRTNEPSFQVMAYYVPSSSVNVKELPFEELTHVIFSFTHVIEHQMKFPDESAGERLKELVAASNDYPHLKVMIACGGWGGSGGFSDMASTKENRQLFVESVISFLKLYDLDGLDLDWEYPGLPGIGNKFRAEDKENFTALTRELRTAMDAYKPGLTLTFASAGWEKYFEHVELNEVMKYVNYMNIMTYDLAGNLPTSNHHTPLFGTPYTELDSSLTNRLKKHNRTYQKRSADDIIQYCLNQGVKPEQIVVGAAFYGRTWNGVHPTNNGLRQPHNNQKSALSFNRIKKLLKENGNYQRYFDSIAKAPFIFNKVDSVFISYDDPESLSLKTRYALDRNLGGIMFWQLSQDSPDYELVKAINAVNYKRMH